MTPKAITAMHELTYHVEKLRRALEESNGAAVAELCADVANFAMKIDELYGE